MMRVGRTKHSPGGEVRWSHYAVSGETAISVHSVRGLEYVATVALWPPSPRAGPDEVWLRTWGPYEGVPEALVEAGVVTLTSIQEPTGFCHAHLAKLTPAALAEMAAAISPKEKAAMDAARRRPR